MKKTVITETISYIIEGSLFRGFLALPPTEQKAPGILIAPAWKGLDEFAKAKAFALAELGYVAFAADLYGDGVVANSDEEASALMLPLFLDRALLRQRINAALEELKKHPSVETSKIGSIGFCFGGLTVIELLRSGATILGAVSFHGILGTQMGNRTANLSENADSIKAKLLVLHGHDDPLVSQEEITHLQKEMDKANVDWQMNIYSQTSHAFTNPQADDTEHGLIFNQRTNDRAWLSMHNFFQEIFK